LEALVEETNPDRCVAIEAVYIREDLYRFTGVEQAALESARLARLLE
jgi:hypothetical protein